MGSPSPTGISASKRLRTTSPPRTETRQAQATLNTAHYTSRLALPADSGWTIALVNDVLLNPRLAEEAFQTGLNEEHMNIAIQWVQQFPEIPKTHFFPTIQPDGNEEPDQAILKWFFLTCPTPENLASSCLVSPHRRFNKLAALLHPSAVGVFESNPNNRGKRQTLLDCQLATRLDQYHPNASPNGLEEYRAIGAARIHGEAFVLGVLNNEAAEMLRQYPPLRQTFFAQMTHGSHPVSAGMVLSYQAFLPTRHALGGASPSRGAPPLEQRLIFLQDAGIDLNDPIICLKTKYQSTPTPPPTARCGNTLHLLATHSAAMESLIEVVKTRLIDPLGLDTKGRCLLSAVYHASRGPGDESAGERIAKLLTTVHKHHPEKLPALLGITGSTNSHFFAHELVAYGDVKTFKQMLNALPKNLQTLLICTPRTRGNVMSTNVNRQASHTLLEEACVPLITQTLAKSRLANRDGNKPMIGTLYNAWIELDQPGLLRHLYQSAEFGSDLPEFSSLKMIELLANNHLYNTFCVFRDEVYARADNVQFKARITASAVFHALHSLGSPFSRDFLTNTLRDFEQQRQHTPAHELSSYIQNICGMNPLQLLTAIHGADPHAQMAEHMLGPLLAWYLRHDRNLLAEHLTLPYLNPGLANLSRVFDLGRILPRRVLRKLSTQPPLLHLAVLIDDTGNLATTLLRCVDALDHGLSIAMVQSSANRMAIGDIDLGQPKTETAFHSACKIGNVTAVQAMVNVCQTEQGRNQLLNLHLGQAPQQCWTPLHSAVFGGKTEVVRFLLQAGVSTKHAFKGITPLHLAALVGLPAIVDILLGHESFNPDDYRSASTTSPTTPLELASLMGYTKVVGTLLAHGNDPLNSDTEDDSLSDIYPMYSWVGVTRAMEFASCQMRLDVVDALMKHLLQKHDVNQQTTRKTVLTTDALESLFRLDFGNGNVLNEHPIPLNRIPVFRGMPTAHTSMAHDPVITFIDALVERGACLIPENEQFNETSNNRIIEHALFNRDCLLRDGMKEWSTQIIDYMNRIAKVQFLQQQK